MTTMDGSYGMPIQRFKKKPVVIEAIQYHPHGNCQEIYDFVGLDSEVNCDSEYCGDSFDIPTLEGVMVASPGDWIIKGVAGEFYPCKPDIFEQTYEEVSDV